VSNVVALVRSQSNVSDSVRKSVELIGGIDIKKGMKVIVKPNICNSKNPHGMVITDFRIIESIINLIKEKGCEPVVVESNNIDNIADNRVRDSGLLKMLNKLNVKFLNLSKDSCITHSVAGFEINLPKTMLEAEYVVNIAKMKTCAHTLVTLSIKNLYGCFKEAKKSKYHKKLNEVLPFLAKTIRSDLNIIDGLTCMEGNGPVVGNPIQLGVVIAGYNPVSVDSFCTKLMGYDPAQIKHIANSAAIGIGKLEFDAVGDPWEPLVCSFEKPYSLKATIKSVSTIRDVYLK
jgi:uncharacterized protein (DUF362 family)